MKQNIILALKGFVIGIANIIPGVSGGTLMITLGIYEQIIASISHFFSQWKENIRFLIPLGIGVALSLLLGSKVVGASLEHYPLPTTLFFLGLILGGIPILWKKVEKKEKSGSNWMIFCLTFCLVALFSFLKSGDHLVSLDHLTISTYLNLFLVGMIASSTMIIPGISGSFMLMLLGFYTPIINTIRALTNFSMLGHHLHILIPFGMGAVVGIIVVAKLIEFFIQKYETKTYYGVLGFVLASIIAIVLPLIGMKTTLLEIVISIAIGILGLMISYRLGGE